MTRIFDLWTAATEKQLRRVIKRFVIGYSFETKHNPPGRFPDAWLWTVTRAAKIACNRKQLNLVKPIRMEGITNNLCKSCLDSGDYLAFVSIRFWRQTHLACVCLGEDHWNERGGKKMGHAKRHLRSISCSQLAHSQFLSYFPLN